ncbi:lysozyme [Microvirga sp. GCM10011540]|uniref:lysozyme n=1 Tax=Microvirga sp. GCM10011540 TaxID=3317338 RepID=UPI00360D71BE
MRNVTPWGENLITNFEGCVLKAYRCSAGVLTIGVGHTSAAGSPVVTAGMVITRDQAMAILRADLDKFEAGVERLLKRPAKDCEFDALTSLAFNIGLGNLSGSTVLRKHNAGDTQGAADAFLAWNKARVKGVLTPLAGLTRRRNSERLAYLGIRDLDFDGRKDSGEPVYGLRVTFEDNMADEVQVAFEAELAGSAFA